MDNVVDGYADEDDDTRGFNEAEFATHDDDASQEHEDDAAYAHGRDKTDLDIACGSRENDERKSNADDDSLYSVRDKDLA